MVARWGAERVHDRLIVGRFSVLLCANNGDVKESGGVTIADAQLIAQLIVGRISSLPPP